MNKYKKLFYRRKHYKETYIEDTKIGNKKCGAIRLIEDINGYVGLMCPNCYNYTIRKINYNGNSKIQNDIDDFKIELYSKRSYFVPYCPDCKEENLHFIELDPNIADVISILNKKNYITLYSCEGHVKNTLSKEDKAYIIFKDRKIVTVLDKLPESWNATEMKIQSDNYTTKNVILIEFIFHNNEEKEKRLQELREFVNSIPEFSLAD